MAELVHHLVRPGPQTREFNRETTKARAALHAKVEAHLNLQACWALLSFPWPTDTRTIVSHPTSDHQPRQPKTTCLARACGPISSGLVRSSLCLAAIRATPPCERHDVPLSRRCAMWWTPHACQWPVACWPSLSRTFFSPKSKTQIGPNQTWPQQHLLEYDWSEKNLVLSGIGQIRTGRGGQ